MGPADFSDTYETELSGSARGESRARTVSFGRNVSGFAQNFKDTLRLHLSAPLAICALVIFVLFMLYAPLKTWYHAWRDLCYEQAALDEISQDNTDILEDLSRLRTYEGIEEEARKRGYVSPGETAITVTGISAVEEEEAEDEEVASGSEESTEIAWYIALGDFIFSYIPL